ncbi:ATP-binding protein [Desulfonema ishimotonii]|uniref:ATP-binding protein n=1 Tax=Desulfonema ishimotonii TaxID=45657 RepID=A0A401G2M9_9BACT|nr:ATP-binding protein [Desulfonema ishimotonii]GBC63484.1 ATP-binding protein [Desulfonema ishimotonii]
MTDKEMIFALHNDLADLNRLEQKLDAFGRAHGICQKSVFEVNLALDELFTNIVHCGYRDETSHRIHFSISLNDDELSVTIEDDGIPFNPLPAHRPEICCPIEERQIGGLGIHLVKQMTDDISYVRAGGKNRLTIKKSVVRNRSSAEG